MIAPNAPHALHMPSHIFLQLGMWQEARTSNVLGWEASVNYVQRKRLTPTLRDYHNLHWLIYASLQQGQYASAGDLVARFVEMREQGDLAPYSARYINDALAAYVIETRQWDRAKDLFATRTASDSRATSSPAREVELCGAPPTPKKVPAVTATSTRAPNSSTPAFIRDYAAAALGSKNSNTISGTDRRALQLRSVALAQEGKYRAAIDVLREAAQSEGRTPKPPGPPSYKPAHELLGELLLLAKQPEEALGEFKIALERHPGRALSLLGSARAEAALGNKAAARLAYTKLLDNWQHADADLPELIEAREYVKSTG